MLKGGLDAVAKDVEPTEEDDSEEDPEWARAAEKPRTGVVLIGRKDWFFADKPSGAVKSALKSVGLAAGRGAAHPRGPVSGFSSGSVDLGRRPTEVRRFSGVLLGRRSGYMMGDLKELFTTGFMLQPLWVGGPTVEDAFSSPIERTVGAPEDGATTGIVAVHPYAAETIPRSS